MEIKSFYFNYFWTQLLIFFSTSLIENGNVRKYLKEKWYIKIKKGTDISSRLSFEYRIPKWYLDKLKYEYETESKWIFVENLYRNTLYQKYLEKITESYISPTYDFLDNPYPIKQKNINLKSEEVFDCFWNNINEIFTFLSHAIEGFEYNIELHSIQLIFENSLPFNQLSDGEFQLLAFYAMIDLFDSEDTIFLFDEIDSHLHYTNIKNIWSIFKEIKGNVITTTHNLESIIQNQFENIRYVENWIIKDELKPKEIISKLQALSSQQQFEIQIAWRIQNIALVDDELDWLIFRKLINKKIGAIAIEKLNKVVPIKRTSSFNTSWEIFWKWKLLFVEEFKNWNIPSSIITKNIFLICDRDSLPITEIKSDLQVNIHREYSSLKFFNGVMTHLLSWRRLEIENYLIHKDLLIWASIFPHLNYSKLKLDECEDIRILDSKPLLKPIYKEPQFDENKLDELIANIPADEISEDIIKMYNFISDKIS